mmetsp:Transcript_4740/g.17695  ORF Transcript_4740/g.17695 Transcript_4740/m.17695 type:complete len:293 (-) Transcript_4740:364-1242(-)
MSALSSTETTSRGSNRTRPFLLRTFLPLAVLAPSTPPPFPEFPFSHRARARAFVRSSPARSATSHGYESSTLNASAMKPASFAASMSRVYSATYHPTASTQPVAFQSVRSGHSAAASSRKSTWGGLNAPARLSSGGQNFAASDSIVRIGCLSWRRATSNGVSHVPLAAHPHSRVTIPAHSALQHLSQVDLYEHPSAGSRNSAGCQPMLFLKRLHMEAMVAGGARPGMKRMPCSQEMVPSRAKSHVASLVSCPISRPILASWCDICVVPEDCVPTMRTGRGWSTATGGRRRPD